MERKRRTAFFAFEKAKRCSVIVELTEGRCEFKPRPDLGLFESWVKARDVASLLNRSEKRLSFPQSNAILASVLLARTQADLTRRGKGYICPCGEYNAIFDTKCGKCGRRHA